MTTRQEEIEGQLIRITDQMANIALYPLTRATAKTLRGLCRRVEELTEVAGAS